MLLYRLALTLAAPIMVLWAMARVLRGQERWADMKERLGFSGGKSNAPSLWVHAASNGELASCEEVLRGLIRIDPEIHLLITTNSITGRALAQSWNMPQITAVLAPFDTRWAARRLITRYRVQALAVVESEFWPNRILAHQAQGLAVVVIGGRLSSKSARGWRKLIWLVRPLLVALTWVIPQDTGSRRRFLRMGVTRDRLAPVTDLKALYSRAGKPDPDPALLKAFPPAQCWFAASTHPGEDEILLAAHQRAQAYWPELQMILAPRHPKRAQEIVTLAETLGLKITRRSQDAPAKPGAIYLADTLGEMPRFYANAEICFVAGSLVDRGGHTPFEPAAFDCALLHGPYLRNFQNAYRRLDSAGGAMQVDNAESLATALGELRDPNRRHTLTRHANEVLQAGGSPEDIAQILLHHMGRWVKSEASSGK